MKAVLWTGVTGLHMQEKQQSFYMISASAWEFQLQFMDIPPVMMMWIFIPTPNLILWMHLTVIV